MGAHNGRLALLTVAAAGTLLAPAAASAEPLPTPPPAPPGLIPPPAAIGDVLAQAGQPPTGPLGLPDLSAYGVNLLLGQTPLPQAPAQGDPAAIPILNAFSPEYLMPQNVAPAAPGEGTPAPGIGPDPDDPGLGRIAFLQRLYEMYRAGDLRGALLGQAPPDQILPAPAAN